MDRQLANSGRLLVSGGKDVRGMEGWWKQRQDPDTSKACVVDEDVEPVEAFLEAARERTNGREGTQIEQHHVQPIAHVTIRSLRRCRIRFSTRGAFNVLRLCARWREAGSQLSRHLLESTLRTREVATSEHNRRAHTSESFRCLVADA